MMNEILKRIQEIGIVPVIKLDRSEDAYPLGKALCDGGLPVAEVTFRSDCAKEAMKIMSEKLPNMLLGAGTVLRKEQVDEALDAGAKFIVSPGLNPEIVRYCIEKDVPIIPGCANASDIECALSLGLSTVKFFPAESLGGISMIKALSAPYTMINFMPTGGIKESNIVEYLNNTCVIACGGTWMIDHNAIQRGDFKMIENLTKKAVKTMLGLHLMHVGINANDATNEIIAEEFSNMLLCEKEVHTASCFAGTTIEVMKNGRGIHGHLAYGVHSVERAVRYYQSIGYTFKQESAIYNKENVLEAIYFEKEIGGFSIHLLKRKD